LTAAEAAPERLSLHRRPVAAHGRILALAWGGWTAGFYSLTLLSFLLQPVQDAFALSESGLAWLTGVAVGMSGAGGLLFGWMSDRLGRRTSLAVALAACFLGNALCGLATSAAWLLAARALTGLGVGGTWGAGQAMMAETFPPALRGRYGAIAQTGSPVGLGLAAAAGSFLAPALGWRAVFVLSALPLLALPALRWVPESDLWLAHRRRLLQRALAASGTAPAAAGTALQLTGTALAAAGMAANPVGAATPRAAAMAVPLAAVPARQAAMALAPAPAPASDPPAAAATATVARQRPILAQLLAGDLAGRFGGAFMLTILNMSAYWFAVIWLPRYLQQRGLSIFGSGWWTLIFVAGSLAGYLSFGWASDVIGRRRAFTLYCAVTAAGLGALALLWGTFAGRSPAAGLACMAIAGLGTGTWSCYGPYLSELFPTRVRGAAMATIMNVSRGVQFAAPLAIAAVGGRGGLAGGVALAAGFAVLAGLWVWTLPETAGVPLPG
jgi:MFS family permease